MAVIGTAHELAGPREQRRTLSARKYRRAFLVTTDNRHDDSNVALAAVGIPPLFSQYVSTTSSDLEALCIRKTARQRSGSRTHWEVQCDYTSEIDVSIISPDNPLLDRPDVSLSFETFRVPIIGELHNAENEGGKQKEGAGEHGQRLVGFVSNSADTAFDPPPEIDESRPVLTVVRNEDKLPFDIAVAMQNSVNSDFWNGTPPRTVKVQVSATRAQREKVRYWQVTYRFSLKRDQWDTQLLNIGPEFKNGADKEKFRDKHQSPRMGLLDANGAALAAGEPPTFVTGRVLREMPFSLLNLVVSSDP